MGMRSKFLLCGGVEFLIALPALTGVVLWMIQQWVAKSRWARTLSSWRNAFLYSCAGALFSIVCREGITKFLAGDKDALGWIISTLSGTAALVGMVATKMRASEIGTTIKSLDRLTWEQELPELHEESQLSQADWNRFRERSTQLAQHGFKYCKQVEELRFRDYWRSSPRKARAAVLGMPLVGITTSVAAAIWARPSLAVTAVWLSATLPLGGSMFAALRLDFAMGNNALKLAGRELCEAAILIRERLYRSPIESPLSFKHRLRRLFV